jgi:hypothetical protein
VVRVRRRHEGRIRNVVRIIVNIAVRVHHIVETSRHVRHIQHARRVAPKVDHNPMRVLKGAQSPVHRCRPPAANNPRRPLPKALQNKQSARKAQVAEDAVVVAVVGAAQAVRSKKAAVSVRKANCLLVRRVKNHACRKWNGATKPCRLHPLRSTAGMSSHRNTSDSRR